MTGTTKSCSVKIRMNRFLWFIKIRWTDNITEYESLIPHTLPLFVSCRRRWRRRHRKHGWTHSEAAALPGPSRAQSPDRVAGHGQWGVTSDALDLFPSVLLYLRCFKHWLIVFLSCKPWLSAKNEVFCLFVLHNEWMKGFWRTPASAFSVNRLFVGFPQIESNILTWTSPKDQEVDFTEVSSTAAMSVFRSSAVFFNTRAVFPGKRACR